MTTTHGGPEERLGWFPLGWASPLPDLERGQGFSLASWIMTS